MVKPPITGNETERLAALRSYNILDTLPEKDFEDITLIASEICQTPISLVSLIDEDRQWFKSHRGLDINETSKDYAFCAHAILEPEKVMVVNDALQDERFADNPLVVSSEVIFYTGVPLVTPDGYALGTLCVIDNKPKSLSEKQLTTLKALAGQVVAQLELRKKNIELNLLSVELKQSNEYLERFAVMAAHDIRNPLTNILLTSKILKDRFNDKLDEKGNRFLDIINSSSHKLLGLLEKMLDYSKSNKILSQNKEEADVLPILQGVLKLVNAPECFSIEIPPAPVKIITSVVAFEQIIINLLNNAVRYNNKPSGLIKIEYIDDSQFYIFNITDNGIGIAPEHFEKIFESMYTLGHKDRFDKNGSGIGLCTVKSLVDALDGEVSVYSVLNEFTTFTVKLKK